MKLEDLCLNMEDKEVFICESLRECEYKLGAYCIRNYVLEEYRKTIRNEVYNK